MYHDSLLAGHQGPYRTAMTIRQKFFCSQSYEQSQEIHRSKSYLLKNKTEVHEKSTSIW